MTKKIIVVVLIILCGICLFGIINASLAPKDNKNPDHQANRQLAWSLCNNVQELPIRSATVKSIYPVIKYMDWELETLFEDDGRVDFPEKIESMFTNNFEKADAILCIEIQEIADDQKKCEFTNEVTRILMGVKTGITFVTYPKGELIERQSFETSSQLYACPEKITSLGEISSSGTIYVDPRIDLDSLE